MEKKDPRELMMGRLAEAGVDMTPSQMILYIDAPDELLDTLEAPVGYKLCTKCKTVKKLYLFNRNKLSKDGCTTQCKECQKNNAAKSYKRTKQKRNYARYYQENKERKQEHARAYYQKNKDSLNEKHKEYVSSAKGKKVMQKAHAKRRQSLKNNKGIPYTREMVIDRDSEFIGRSYPICWICKEPIKDTSGEGLHLDHVISVGNGGLDCFTNIACTHKTCNLTKEKDDRKLEAAAVEEIQKRTYEYMDEHPEYFDESINEESQEPETL